MAQEKSKEAKVCVGGERPPPTQPDEHGHSAGPSLPVGTTMLYPAMFLHLFLGLLSFPSSTCLHKGPNLLSTLATLRFVFGEVLPPRNNLSDFPQYQNEIPSGASHFEKGQSDSQNELYYTFFPFLFFWDRVSLRLALNS